MKRHYVAAPLVAAGIGSLLLLTLQGAPEVDAAATAADPGMRSGASAGDPLPGLTAGQQALFDAGRDAFGESEVAADGLGPRMNLDSCAGCHIQPAVGGSSPAENPQVKFATKDYATNVLPSFISAYGPVREARFVKNPDGSRDGGVHALFTITGRSDAPGCQLAQPDFETELAAGNVIFRISTPLFGAGLIEQIPDSAILANQAANADAKLALGIGGKANIVLAGNAITGQPNLNGNDGTIARFGWKAQNKSLLLFAGEAYNVEMGISNELFQTERDETATCQFATTPNDVSDADAQSPAGALSDVEKFALFMRFLAPPAPSPDSPGGATSIDRGAKLFARIGCDLCHTPTLMTAKSTVEALSERPANLYSDLLVHNMGSGLADGVKQGQAGPNEFRTAPLWGLGQRTFLLHDGRTSDLIEAIQAHRSAPTATQRGSEANAVINNFNQLTEPQKQHLLNFLRSL
jgi:CxxC motif-containing protein (DUF1111 family)